MSIDGFIGSETNTAGGVGGASETVSQITGDTLSCYLGESCVAYKAVIGGFAALTVCNCTDDTSIAVSGYFETSGTTGADVGG